MAIKRHGGQVPDLLLQHTVMTLRLGIPFGARPDSHHLSSKRVSSQSYSAFVNFLLTRSEQPLNLLSDVKTAIKNNWIELTEAGIPCATECGCGVVVAQEPSKLLGPVRVWSAAPVFKHRPADVFSDRPNAADVVRLRHRYMPNHGVACRHLVRYHNLNQPNF